jgi:high-affinity Fe2+/Pb2+ permease
VASLPSASKTIAVVLALVLAGLATFAIFTYVRGIEQRAFEDAELVEVFVAQDVIAEGVSSLRRRARPGSSAGTRGQGLRFPKVPSRR